MYGFSIRAATLGDCEPVVAFLTDAYRARYGDRYPAKLIETIVPTLVHTGDQSPGVAPTFQIVEEKGVIVGCGGWSLAEPVTGEVRRGVGHIRFFGTSPDHARQGIARLIFSRVRFEAAQQAMASLECLASLPARRTYEALGFSSDGGFDVTLDDGTLFPLVRMTHPLARTVQLDPSRREFDLRVRAADGEAVDP